jgi:hypothetical protein
MRGSVVEIQTIPSGAMAAFVNMIAILVSMWIGNSSDFLREKLQRVRAPGWLGVCVCPEGVRVWICVWLGVPPIIQHLRMSQCISPALNTSPSYPPPIQDKNMRCWSLLQLLTDIPDATIGVLVGMAAGLLLSKVWGLRVKFSDAVFFYGVLPPIIFCTSRPVPPWVEE